MDIFDIFSTKMINFLPTEAVRLPFIFVRVFNCWIAHLKFPLAMAIYFADAFIMPNVQFQLLERQYGRLGEE